MQNKNSFKKLQKSLQKNGWYVVWDAESTDIPAIHPDGPMVGKPTDPDKVLISSTDYHGLRVDCPVCLGQGNGCGKCHGTGEIIDTSYEYEGGSFYFGNSDRSIEHLIDSLPLLERSECNYDWDILGSNRIFISWSKTDPTLWRLALVLIFYGFLWLSGQLLFESCADQASCYFEGMSGLALDQYMDWIKS